MAMRERWTVGRSCFLNPGRRSRSSGNVGIASACSQTRGGRLTGTTLISPFTAGLNITAVIQGSGSLIKAGSGILQLSGANTFTGGVDLQAGGLYLTAAQGLGIGGTLTIHNNTSISGSVTATNPITWDSGAKKYQFPEYPKYWRVMGPGKGGSEDLRPLWKGYKPT